MSISYADWLTDWLLHLAMYHKKLTYKNNLKIMNLKREWGLIIDIKGRKQDVHCALYSQHLLIYVANCLANETWLAVYHWQFWKGIYPGCYIIHYYFKKLQNRSVKFEGGLKKVLDEPTS